MFIKTANRSKGKYISIVNGTWDPVTKNSRTVTVRSLGYAEQIAREHGDVMAYARKVLEECEAEAAKQTQVVIAFNPNEQFKVVDDGMQNTVYCDDIRNLGYGVIKEIYLRLKLDKFWNWKSRGYNIEYSVDRIFRLLVYGAILFPGSKKHVYDNRNIFFEPMDDFTLDDIYRALDVIADQKNDLQKWAFHNSTHICKRDLSMTYFDCTNYYFDISHPDLDELDEDGNPVDKDGKPCDPKYRKRGPEKNKRPDPIVGMGLLMDRSGIPLGFDLFPGNESEKVHMRPILEEYRKTYPEGRTVIVADRGLNTADNIFYINGTNTEEVNNRDGYIYGQSVRGASEEFQKWVLEKEGYRTDKILVKSDKFGADPATDDLDGTEQYIVFIHKSRIERRTIEVNVTAANGGKKKKKVVVDQKQLVYYSEKYAKRQKRQREMMIERAKDLIDHPEKYDRVTSAGSASYVVNISFDSQGNVVDGKALYLDKEKIKAEEQFDGYYSIVTSELGIDDWDIRNAYRGLAKIEDTFKISKSEFSARPVFVRTNKHIDGHFTACYIALLIIRLIQTKLGDSFPIGQILNSLRNYSCDHLDNNFYKLPYYDTIIDRCGQTFGLSLSYKYRTRDQLRRQLRY